MVNLKNIKRKEFAFTRLMTCGLCKSGITADEKFKKLKDGSTRRYVYYGCTKYNDKNCSGGYIREEELIEQLITLFDTISFNEIGMKDEIKQALEAHNEFQEDVLGKETKKIKVKEVDIRNYAKFILKKKPMNKKRELLDHLKSTLMLKEKNIYLN
jgi:hypothetical protein